MRHYHKRGEVRVISRGTRILVAAPYNEEFRQRARMVYDNHWRAAVKVWSFPMNKLGEVRDAIDAVYGREAVPQWMRERDIDGGER